MAYNNYGNYGNYGGYAPNNYVNYTTPTPNGNNYVNYTTPTPNVNNGYFQAPMNQPQQQTNNAGFVWVQGEAAAKAYPVAAGNSVLLMDSDAPVLYMKSTDNTGKPLPMETYDLVKRNPVSYQMQQAPQQPQIDLSEYVKMSDLEAKVNELVNKALEK